jgi:hypothetical protein
MRREYTKKTASLLANVISCVTKGNVEFFLCKTIDLIDFAERVKTT